MPAYRNRLLLRLFRTIELGRQKHPSDTSTPGPSARRRDNSPTQGPGTRRRGRPARSAHDPPTIRSLQERIRALLSSQLEAFRRAFRFAFQVPEDTRSIAGLITEQRHRLWIQQYLSQTQAQPRPA